MTSKSILLVEGDAYLREALAEYLALYSEFKLLQEDKAATGIQMALSCHIDLLIMDVGLPDMNGREAIKVLRNSGFIAPIMVMSGLDTDSDTILGLEAGADGYVTKPFKFAVFLARIRALLRHHGQHENAVYNIGQYKFQPSKKQLLKGDDGHKIKLTEKETAVLKYLYRAGPQVIAREVLLKEVWGYNADVTTNTLETHIYRLRQKIEHDSSFSQLLVTGRGGYKLQP